MALPARRPAARAPVSQSLAQVANQRVNQQLNPQLAAQNAFNTQQNTAIRQFANSLLGKLQPVAGQVGADYNQAITQVKGLSGQAAQYLNAQNPAASQQALLGAVNAPPEQQAQSAAQLGQTFRGGAGVLAFTGGAIPGTELATDKAAAMAQARQLPGLAALKGQQDLASALWQQGQDRRELLATRPKLYQAAAQDIRTTQAAKTKNMLAAQAAREKVREFGITRAEKVREFGISSAQKQRAADFSEWYRTQGLNQSQQRINQKAQEFGITASQRDQSIAISQQNANTSAARAAAEQAPKYSASVSRSLGYRADQYGNPVGGAYTGLPGFKATKTPGIYTKVGTARTGAQAKPLSRQESQTVTNDINQGIATAFSGGNYDAQGNPLPGGGYDKDGTPLPPVDRAGALAEARKHGYLTSPQYAKIVMDALNRYYPPPSAANLFSAAGQSAAKRATTR